MIRDERPAKRPDAAMATGRGPGRRTPPAGYAAAPLSLRTLPPELDEGPAFAGDPVLGWDNGDDAAPGPPG